MQNNHLIYKITNKINRKSYIGQTTNLKARIDNHQKSSSCAYIHRAMIKYGIDNFDVEVLSYDLHSDECDNKEKEYILKYNTLVPNGYNLVLEDCRCRTFHDTTKLKMSHNRQGIGHNKLSLIGITYREKDGIKCFRARITKNSKTFCKTYPSMEEAAESYDKVAIFLYGDSARVNYPEKIPLYKQEDLQDFFELFSSIRKKSSKFIGISWQKQCHKWKCYLYDCKRQPMALGLFDSEIDAATFYDKMKWLLMDCSDLKKFNFPDEISKFNIDECYKIYYNMLLKDRHKNKKTIYEWNFRKN